MYKISLNTLSADKRRGNLLSIHPCEITKQALMYKNEFHQCICNILFYLQREMLLGHSSKNVGFGPKKSKYLKDKNCRKL